MKLDRRNAIGTGASSGTVMVAPAEKGYARSRHRLACYAVLALSAAVSLCAQGQALPLKNPSFEDGDPDSGPKGWSFEAAEEASATPSWCWLPSSGHGGGHCISGGCEQPGDVGRWVQEGVPIPENARHLRVTAWMKAVDVRSSAGVVAVAFLDREGQPLSVAQNVLAAASDRDWTRHVSYVEVPEAAAQLDISCSVGFAFTKCGRFMWDDISLDIVEVPVEPVTLYVDDTPPPEPTRAEKRRGFMIFSRPWMETVFKNTVLSAEDRIAALSIDAVAGTYEPTVVIVRALRDLDNVSVSVSDFEGEASQIPASRVDVRSVAYRTEVGQNRWGLFNETVMRDVPQFLEKRSPLGLAAGNNQPFWLTVHMPSDAAPGVYRAMVTITTDAGSTQLPLTVRVRDLALLKPKGVMFSLYARMARSDAWINETYADMRSHGVTGVALTGDGGMPIRFEDGKPVVDWTGDSPLERNMEACKRHGLMEPALWLMSGEVPSICKQAGPLESDAFAKAYRSIIGQIVEHGKEQGWPEMIFQPVDEPFEWEQHLPLNKRLLTLLKSVGGVRTEGDGMNGKWENFTRDVYELTDVVTLHDGPMLDRHAPVDMEAWQTFHDKATRDDKRIWFYNIDLPGWHPEPVRYMTGFGLWKSVAHGVIEWCYMCPVTEDDPGAVYADPTALLYRYPEAPGESGGPSIAYEAMREGAEDYQYLYTLRALCDSASEHKDAAVRDLARSAWAAVQEKLAEANFNGCTGVAMQGNWTGACEVLEDGRRVVRGNHALDNGWGMADYDALRSQVADSIQQLRKASGLGGRR
jgi:hypothetical protein